MALKTLDGVRVLDFSSYLAGPYGCTLLGDMGADVIKIEVPGGDMMRHYPSTLEGENRYHLGVNRNKRGIVLDLKTPTGRQAAHALVATADVVVLNFRPGVAPRIGLDFETLKQLQPRLVYCSITGFGERGPYAQRPGFDQVLQCMTGIAHAQGADQGTPSVVWGSAVDFYAASLVAMAASAALFDRERTQQAQYVEVSLLRAALAMQAGRLVWGEGEGRDVERDLKPGRLSGIHPTRDGHIYLQANGKPFWTALCELTGLAHLLQDERFDTMVQRKAHEAELLPLLRGALQTRSAREWETVFAGRVPCAVVGRLEDMFDHPQAAAEGLFETRQHPAIGSYRTFTGPVVINREQGLNTDRRAPLLGEHTAEVLAEIGFSPERLVAPDTAQALG